MDYLKLVEQRKSIRDFEEKQVGQEQLKELHSYFRQSRRLFPEVDVEMILLDSRSREVLEGNAGYQGKIFGAPNYLLLLSDNHPHKLENIGYLCEDMILKLLEMGFDSCWLTVQDGHAVLGELMLPTGKSLLSVVAFGYGKKEREVINLDIKRISDVDVVKRAGHVAPKMELKDMVYWEKWGSQVILDENVADEGLVNALYAASLAPTFLNRQSFRFILDSGVAVLVSVEDEMTGAEDQKLNMGAVMLNFAAALDERRPYETQWKMEKRDGDYDLPAGCKIAGWCRV